MRVHRVKITCRGQECNPGPEIAITRIKVNTCLTNRRKEGSTLLERNAMYQDKTRIANGAKTGKAKKLNK